MDFVFQSTAWRSGLFDPGFPLAGSTRLVILQHVKPCTTMMDAIATVRSPHTAIFKLHHAREQYR